MSQSTTPATQNDMTTSSDMWRKTHFLWLPPIDTATLSSRWPRAHIPPETRRMSQSATPATQKKTWPHLLTCGERHVFCGFPHRCHFLPRWSCADGCGRLRTWEAGSREHVSTPDPKKCKTRTFRYAFGKQSDMFLLCGSAWGFSCSYLDLWIYWFTFIHSCIHSFTHSFIHSLSHSFTHSVIHALIHAFMHSCIHAFMHSCIHAFMHSCIHAFTHSFIHSFVHSFIHSFIHSLFIYLSICLLIYLFIHSFIGSLPSPHWLIRAISFHPGRGCPIAAALREVAAAGPLQQQVICLAFGCWNCWKYAWNLGIEPWNLCDFMWGFRKIRVPLNHPPSIWGYPHVWKPSCDACHFWRGMNSGSTARTVSLKECASKWQRESEASECSIMGFS